MENERIVYELHTVIGDVSLKDTRSIAYRTQSGRIRPYLSFCFVPRTHLVLAYNLSASPVDQQMLAALLSTAVTQSSSNPYGGIPDEVWFFNCPPLIPPTQQMLEYLGILIQNRLSDDESPDGKIERFLLRLTREFWEPLSDQSFPGASPSEKVASLTVSEVDQLLRAYLLAYNQAISSNSEASRLPIRRLSFLQQAHLSQLPLFLDSHLPRTLTHKGVSYRGKSYWHEQFATLAPGTTIFLRPVPSFSVSSPETIEVFYQNERICSLGVQL